jgi:hypothetical protein
MMSPCRASTLLLRHPPNATPLVRQLASCLPTGAPAPAGRLDVAERLGQWLDVADAIALRSAHAAVAQAGRPSARSPCLPAASAHALQAELGRVRALLTHSIRTRPSARRCDPEDLDTERVLALQHHQELQRRMALNVDALRQHMRQTLARGSPRQAQIAALDAALEQMLGGREQRLLGQLPTVLKARWAALRTQAALQTAAHAADDGLAWLECFHTELEQTLLAELDHRLLPVLGMIESLMASLEP